MSKRNAGTPLSQAIKACMPAFASIAFISVFINLTMLAMPLYSMQISDRVMQSRNGGTLVMLTIIVVVFLALYGFLEYVRAGIQLRASIMFDDIIRHSLFDGLMRTDVTGASRIGPQALRDAEMLREAISSGLVSTMFDAPWAPIFVLLCFFLHPMLGVVALCGALAMLVFTWLSEGITKSSVRHASQLSAEASQFAASALKNGEAVRGLGMGDTISEKWNATQNEVVATQAVTSERVAAVNAVSKFVSMLVQAALLGVGAWLAIEQLISPGVMMASSIMMGRALSPVQMVVGQWKRIVALRGSYARLQQIFANLPDQGVTADQPDPIGKLDVQQIVVVPPTGGRPVVKGVSFAAAPGEVVAIIGSSGGGKSSMARALAGVWPLVQGTIRLDGKHFQEWDPNRLGKHIGYLPQNVELFAGTIAQNIARLGKVDDKAVIAAAKAAGAHDLILRLPKGYDTQIGEGGGALSGGTRQRVGLARALYGNPRLIILDEPNANLDDEGDRALHRAILEMKKDGRTVVVVTHKPQMLSVVDKILVMSFGLTLAFGPRDAVLQSLRAPNLAVAAGNEKPRLQQAQPARA
jgi:ATP-binding cassette subfamily C protein/ATP-binding cassette subfamily C protein EexD